MDDLIKRQDAIDAIDKRANMAERQSDFWEGLIIARSIVDELPPAQQWIPCNERLPNIGEDILFSVADLYTAEGCLRDDGDYCQFRWNSIIPKDRVTAWMPLPKPYKVVKE